MAVLQLTEGTHTIRWTLGGYEVLEAQVSVSPTGAVTCLSVVGGSCNSITPPGVVVSGSTVTGYLKATATPTPTPTPAPTPKPAADICGWIIALGGWKNIMAFDIMTLKAAYSDAADVGFKVTAAHIMASKAYYSEKTGGTPGSGNGLSGCNFT